MQLSGRLSGSRRAGGAEARRREKGEGKNMEGSRRVELLASFWGSAGKSSTVSFVSHLQAVLAHYHEISSSGSMLSFLTFLLFFWNKVQGIIQ